MVVSVNGGGECACVCVGVCAWVLVCRWRNVAVLAE